jgi:hypothetical protein
MVAVLIFVDRTRTRMVIFFLVLDVFFDINDTSATTAVVSRSVASIITYPVDNTKFFIASQL